MEMEMEMEYTLRILMLYGPYTVRILAHYWRMFQNRCLPPLGTA